MNNKNAGRERRKLIDNFEASKARRIKAIQRAFKLAITAHLLSSLTDKKGLIKNTGSNHLAIVALDAVQAELYTSHVLPFLNWVNRASKRILKANVAYFKGLSSQTVAVAGSKLNNRLGIKAGSQIRRGGFLSALGDTSKAFNSVKGLATRTVSSGKVSVAEFKQTLNTFNKAEPLVRDMSERAIDLFVSVDRNASEQFRQDLGLRFAIYQGGIIKTTRPFCAERNDQVYTVEEIDSWKNLEFAGKSSPYDPFVDCGGYNCRHVLDWISDKLAYALRPELKP